MRNVLLLMIVCLFAACSSSSTQSNHDTTIVDYNIKQGKPLPSKDWHCYNIDEDKLCTPATWGFVKQDKFFFMSDLSHVAPGSYFVVTKQDKKATGLDALKYLKQLYAELKQDSTGTLTGWQASRITYSDKEVIYSDYNISMGKDPYILYSTVFEVGNDLYDIALKISAGNAKTYHEAYQDIIFNFYHKNSLIFTSKDKIVTAKVIDLTKL
ncbi:MAG TPA: hypothetical protein VHA56_10885 [Mucilaginibacter sp.]|nr:hypothetical protein [Mucilaginibacter sp.]